MIYPETRGDYFNKNWNAAEYKDQLEIALDEKAYIGATEEGFVRFGLLGKIAQLIKRCLGWTDYSETHRVRAAWLKFLYYGEAQGFLQNGDIHQLKSRIVYSSESVSPSIRSMVEKIENFHEQYSQMEQPEHLVQLREIVTVYHQRHQHALLPGRWSRVFHPLKLDVNTLFCFGDTPLQLSEKFLAQKSPDPASAFNYLQIAFGLKNDSPEFQEKLAAQLDKLENHDSYLLKARKKVFQKLWIELAETAQRQNMPAQSKIYLQRALQADANSPPSRLEIGKIYLRNKEYALAQPFLEELQTANANDPQILLQIGDLHWDQKNYQGAAAIYERVLKLSEHSLNRSEKGRLFHRLGTAHMNGLIGSNASLLAAIRYFTAALRSDRTVANYQEDASEAFSRHWKKSPDTFAAECCQEWNIVMPLLGDSILLNPKFSIAAILIGLSEQSFNSLQNYNGRAYLETLFTRFLEQADSIIEGLGLAIRFHDSAHFENRFEAWERAHYANPYLIEKIGDAFWDKKKDLAIKKYEKAIELYSKRLPLCKDEKERADCQRHMAGLHAKLGENQLPSRPEEAHKQFERAFSLDPERHGPALSKASLAVADAEKNRTFLRRNDDKIIAFLKRAFESHQQKGTYLIDLLQRYLDSKTPGNAATLYLDIQRQPWSNELTLPAKVYSQLADLLEEQQHDEAAFTCFKNAYEQEPSNEGYKEKYLKFALGVAKQHLENIPQSGNIEETAIEALLSLARKMENCLKVKPDDERFKTILGRIYWTLGKCTIQRCLFPRSREDKDVKRDAKQVKSLLLKHHEEKLKAALQYYDKGLTYDPQNPCLHFDRGVFFEFWRDDFEKAYESYEKAVKHQERNPFYQQLLAMAHGVLWGTNDKTYEKHEADAKKFAKDFEEFEKDLELWTNEYFFKMKTKTIDPHAYTQEKKKWGLF